MSTVIPSNFKGWKWRYNVTTTYNLSDLVPYDGAALGILSDSGKPMVYLDAGFLTIYRHYHYDGATWAPDFEKGLEGYGVHDALLQLLDKYPNAFPEQWAHDAMKEIHDKHSFKLGWLYHWGVSSWPRKIYKLITES